MTTCVCMYVSYHRPATTVLSVVQRKNIVLPSKLSHWLGTSECGLPMGFPGFLRPPPHFLHLYVVISSLSLISHNLLFPRIKTMPFCKFFLLRFERSLEKQLKFRPQYKLFLLNCLRHCKTFFLLLWLDIQEWNITQTSVTWYTGVHYNMTYRCVILLERSVWSSGVNTFLWRKGVKYVWFKGV